MWVTEAESNWGTGADTASSNRIKTQLRETLSQQQQPVLQAQDGNQSTAVLAQAVEDKTQEISRLEVELLRASEREKMLRKFMVLSWGGFFAVTAIIVTASKSWLQQRPY